MITAFRASHRHEFLDYFRVPHEVLGPQLTEGWPAFLGRLHGIGDDGREAGSLWWVRTRARAQLGGVGRAGRYRRGRSTFAAHVVPDGTSATWLARRETGWRPTEPVLDEHGTAVASVWRDTDGSAYLPFDVGEVMTNFWSERYRSVGRNRGSALARSALIRGYYLARPLIPRPAQLALRRGFTRVQDRASFPGWPVEDSLHDLYSWLLALLADVRGEPVPWLGTWPDGRSWALVLTHDVETEFGYRNMHLLRDSERAAGYRSSWNFVPERYRVESDVLAAVRAEGCEVGVHGLRHDGRDLGSRALFEQRLPAIRSHAQSWQAVGFRSPATQRVWEWMPELGFDYDSSSTDTDPYEPQPGGCCTYLPFFNEELVELPITLPQDHTLFAILQDGRGDVWVDKARHLRDRGGMALVLAHPDYATDPHLVAAWERLLEEFRDDDTAWRALPREVAAWWRGRAASVLRRGPGGWRIEGPAALEGQVELARADVPLRLTGSVS